MRPPPLEEVFDEKDHEHKSEQLEQFNLKMEWIMGSKNMLADSLSRLLEVCPEAVK